MKRSAQLALVLVLAAAACNAVTPSLTPTPALMEHSPTAYLPSLTPTIFVEPTLTPSPVPSSGYPVPFPMPPLTDEQIAQAAECDFKAKADERYPDRVTSAQLADAYAPETNCDWATLAYAFAKRREGGDPHPKAVDAFQRSLAGNPAYALLDENFYGYFGGVDLVQNPAFAAQEIKEVEISYEWWGLGNPANVSFSLRVQDADTQPVVTSPSPEIGKDVQKATVQALGVALTDLVPIDGKFQVLPCTDDNPSWQVRLTFADGSQLEMETDSNMLPMGGPWQTLIDGQAYMQVSADFTIAMGNLAKELSLPLGEPMVMYCDWQPVLQPALSEHVAPPPTPTYDPTMPAIYTAVYNTVQAIATQRAGTPTP